MNTKINFNQFVNYAKENSEKPHWSFKFEGFVVTHVDDNCYLIKIEKNDIYFRKNMSIYIGHYVVKLYDSNEELVTTIQINQ